MTDPTPVQAGRGLWAFWLACVLSAFGALAPFLISEGSDRIRGALIPFVLAALAFAALAMLHHLGRPISTALYLVASLALVYGLLALLALPLRLAVLGTCPGPVPCTAGTERPMSSSETTAMGFAIGMGIVAVMAGFFGLRTQYRRHRASRQTAAQISPPARRIPPVDAKPQTERTPAQPEYQTELPAHKLDPELPAHTTENKPKTPPDAPTSTP